MEVRVAWVSRPLASGGTLLAPEEGGTVPAALRPRGARRHDPGSQAGGRYLQSELFGPGLSPCWSCLRRHFSLSAYYPEVGEFGDGAVTPQKS